MELIDKQHERIALWLDGGDITLTPSERQAAEQIRADEALLSTLLAVEAPPEALARASRRMAGELARPSRRLAWVGRLAIAAAAAGIVIAVWSPFDPPETRLPPVPAEPTAAYASLEDELRVMVSSTDAGVIDLVADEIAGLHADLLVSRDAGEVDMALDALEVEIGNVLMDDSSSWLIEPDPWS